MTEDPKKTRSDYEGLQLQAGRKKRKTKVRFRTLLTNSHTLVPLLSGVIQVLSGLAVVCITILGLISPLWISAIMSFVGCILFIAGGFLIYHTITSQGSFDGLLNQAIRRVINSQN
jgi:hypothetical protein